MLPRRDGWSICDAVRQQGISTPILMLTARDSIDDRVRGLDNGADDYLTKPFDMRELRARIAALLRRETAVRTGVIEIADLRIDTRSHTVERGGKSIVLTRREFDLLEALARNAGRTLTRDVILENVWNADENLENTVNFHVTSLRKKIDADFHDKLIETVHGFGYRLKSPTRGGGKG
jgi:two-component system copper resistance phosphate regulon response regulator CusR